MSLYNKSFLQVFAVVLLLSVYLLVVEPIMLSRITGIQRCVASMKEMGTVSWRKLWTASVHLTAVYRCWSQMSDRLQLTHIGQTSWLNRFHHQPLYVLFLPKNWVIVHHRVDIILTYRHLCCCAKIMAANFNSLSIILTWTFYSSRATFLT